MATNDPNGEYDNVRIKSTQYILVGLVSRRFRCIYAEAGPPAPNAAEIRVLRFVEQDTVESRTSYYEAYAMQLRDAFDHRKVVQVAYWQTKISRAWLSFYLSRARREIQLVIGIDVDSMKLLEKWKFKARK